MAQTTLNVAAGFHRDVTKLLERFVNGEEIRMAQFTKIWREMNFLKVFMYREELEIILFTEECFRILLRMIQSQQPLPYRVGALFTLYSCYLMQPSEPKVMIRLVPDIWKALQNILEESQFEAWQNEVKFVFWTLFYENAFLYTATPSSIGLVNICSEDEKSSGSGNFCSTFDEYMNSDHKSLKEIHERYMSMKDSLDSSAAKTVQMVNKELISTVEKKVTTLYAKCSLSEMSSRKRAGEASESENDNQSETSEVDDEDEDNVYARRQKLRERQMSAHVKQSKSRRHRTVEKPQATTSGKKKASRGRPRANVTGGNKKGCSRTTFEDLNLPGDTLENQN